MAKDNPTAKTYFSKTAEYFPKCSQYFICYKFLYIIRREVAESAYL